MSQKIKTPRKVVYTLAAGFGLGIIAMGTVQSGIVIRNAYAQNPKVSLRTASGATTESMTELHNLDSSFENLAQFVAPAVVDIRATTGRSTDASGSRQPIKQGEGSGFIFRNDGYIITNDHVVDGADSVKVILKDGREYDGKVTRAADSDLAVIKIEAKNLPVLAFSDSSELRPGQLCMAIGSPFGMANSVTFGHVSALGRDTPIASDMSERYYPDLIQTDASINMGNSGGPLVDVDGRVIGINTAIYSPSGTSAGIGFAIPSNQAKFIADMLVSKGKVTRSMIGLYPTNLKEYEKKDKGLTGGAVVTQLSEGGPAQKAGLKEGDIITKVASTPISSQLDLRNAMLIYAPGTSVQVDYLRDGKAGSTTLKLEKAKSMVDKPQQPQGQQFGGNGDGVPFDLPKGFDMPDMKEFQQFPNRNRSNQPDDGQDVPAIKTGAAKLGVRVGSITPELRQQFKIPTAVNGAVIASVEDGSVASKIGLEPGDVITQLGSKTITKAEDLTSAMASYKWGDSGKIKFSHYDQNSTMQNEKTFTFR